MKRHSILLLILLAVPAINNAVPRGRNPKLAKGPSLKLVQATAPALISKKETALVKEKTASAVAPTAQQTLLPAQQVQSAPAPAQEPSPKVDDDDTAAIVLQSWAGLAANMIEIIKDPHNPIAVAHNVGSLFAGFAGIIAQIVKRNKVNNFAYLLATLENPEYQDWLTSVITQQNQ